MKKYKYIGNCDISEDEGNIRLLLGVPGMFIAGVSGLLVTAGIIVWELGPFLPGIRGLSLGIIMMFVAFFKKVEV